MFGGKSLIQDQVVIALVEDQHAVVFQHGVEFGQCLASILLIEHMSERISQTDNRVEFSMHVAIEKAPVGLHSGPRRRALANAL